MLLSSEEQIEDAAEVLGRNKDARAVDALIEAAISDESAQTRSNSAYALDRIDDPRTLDRLFAMLDSDDPEARVRVAEALRKIKDPEVSKVLAGLLEDPDLKVRKTVSLELGKLKDPSTFDALMATLDDENVNVRLNAVYALGQLKNPNAATALIALLEDASAGVRRNSIEALVSIGATGAVDGLLKILDNDEPRLRRKAAQALGKLKCLKAVDALTAALESDDEYLRANAAALGDIADHSAVGPLTAAAKDTPYDRHHAISALGKIGGDEAAQVLISIFHESMESEDKPLQDLVLHVLARARDNMSASRMEVLLNAHAEKYPDYINTVNHLRNQLPGWTYAPSGSHNILIPLPPLPKANPPKLPPPKVEDPCVNIPIGHSPSMWKRQHNCPQ